jgi:hypothetical protein
LARIGKCQGDTSPVASYAPFIDDLGSLALLDGQRHVGHPLSSLREAARDRDRESQRGVVPLSAARLGGEYRGI